MGLIALPVLTACTFTSGKRATIATSEPPLTIDVSELPPENSEPPEPVSYPEGSMLGFLGEPILFDVTGDGNDDECYCNMYGSGMVRVQCIVKDTTNDKKYVLDGYDYSYDIEGVEDGQLVVIENGPYGYGDPLTKTKGTVRIINDRLVFVADVDEMKTGLIVKRRIWTETGGKDWDTTTVTILRHGEEVYSGYSSEIKVDSLSYNEKEITLAIDGCLVEPNADGSIDLRKEPLKEITMQKGDTITLKSQTMDGGVTLEITFK